ncbi:MAG: Glu-tRNA(Gln) amidotransferase GatDE subunit E, partial [Candidatus Thermoplasmatota archaeon]|nr:Glu-tRNA(Gln) amidotransferase GatDE subunit E [Candidatus Thermoplasmatota archaeon]
MSSSEPDFKALGFKCGLEIHQQLLTERKLFCRCPIKNRNDEPDITILRHMRPTLSEMGTYDGTALMEYKTKKQILYQLFEDTVCTYEMDDTPPFPINEEALDIALQLTMLLGCKVVDELHVSRKQYLDGSIPTGFQRTAITGVEGELPYKEGRTIGIRQISIEEDSCREVEDHGHNIIFKTDRLGTPLIEVVTEPDILHPSEVAEVASLLGRAMRAT